MVEFIGVSQDRYRGYRMLSYTRYKENYCKCCKLAFISAFEVFTLNRNSLNYDVISLPVTVTNCYTKALSK